MNNGPWAAITQAGVKAGRGSRGSAAKNEGPEGRGMTGHKPSVQRHSYISVSQTKKRMPAPDKLPPEPWPGFVFLLCFGDFTSRFEILCSCWSTQMSSVHAKGWWHKVSVFQFSLWCRVWYCHQVHNFLEIIRFEYLCQNDWTDQVTLRSEWPESSVPFLVSGDKRKLWSSKYLWKQLTNQLKVLCIKVQCPPCSSDLSTNRRAIWNV